MTEWSLLQTACLIFLLGATVSFVTAGLSKPFSIYSSGIFGILASASAAVSGLLTLIHQSSFTLAIPGLHLPYITPVFTVDPLAAFFIMLIGLAGVPISLYSIGYLKAEYQYRSVGVLGALYHLFMLAMLMVLMASDALGFLIAWECMALLSFCLVIFDTQSRDAQRAGFVYLLMTHIGTACLLIMYLLLAQHSGQLTFAAFTAQSGQLALPLKSILFGCAIIGFGAKAGLIPLHIWLPEAHPAAPSHISALMSGVMLKTAVYGLLRCVFDFMAPFPAWWGIALASMALVTAVLGIIYASVENDLKRLLAYSSIENMGLVFFAIGLALIFAGHQSPNWSSLFLVAALFHALNHSLFKSLLFMAAGSVLSATHTRSLENLGGLIHKMPVTAVLFLIGALAISALPPLNGFMGEWLLFQGLILSTQHASAFLRVFLPLCAALLGLTGALVATTFVKAFSGAFLAIPRTHHVDHAREVSPTMLVSMAIPAALCLALGLSPALTIPVLSQLSGKVLGTQPTRVNELLHSNDTVVLNGFAAYTPLLLLFILIVGIGLAWLLPRTLGKKTAIRKEMTWSCGVTPSPEFEYTPTGFSQPLEVIFSKFHATLNGYHEYFYLPVINGLLSLSRRLSVIQAGNTQVYLAYMLLTLLLCLVWIKL